MKHLPIFIIFGLMIFVYSCNTRVEKPVDNGLKYFPLTVGNYWIYDVSEINFDTLTQNNTTNYQEKHEIIETYKSQLNENTYIIHVSTRGTSADAWTYSQTWSAKVSSLNEIIVNEENVAFIKLLLPVKEGSTWKGNKYNTIEIDRNNGRIDDFLTLNVGKLFGDFSNTITVQESDELNFSYKDIRHSIYAENVGLVYRINTYIEYCDQSNCFGLYIRKHEHSKTQTLIEYVIQ